MKIKYFIVRVVNPGKFFSIQTKLAGVENPLKDAGYLILDTLEDKAAIGKRIFEG